MLFSFDPHAVRIVDVQVDAECRRVLCGPVSVDFVAEERFVGVLVDDSRYRGNGILTARGRRTLAGCAVASFLRVLPVFLPCPSFFLAPVSFSGHKKSLERVLLGFLPV